MIINLGFTVLVTKRAISRIFLLCVVTSFTAAFLTACDRSEHSEKLKAFEELTKSFATEQSVENYEAINEKIASLPESEKPTAYTLLRFAVKNKPVSPDYVDQFEKLGELLASGSDADFLKAVESANPNQFRTPDGQTLLMIGLGVGATESKLRALIAAGVDVNAVEERGRTAAHLVLDWGGADFEQQIAFLKSQGANLKLRSSEGPSVEDRLKVRLESK